MHDETPHGQPTATHTAQQGIDLPGLVVQEARQVVIFTGDFLTTGVTLLSSALSLVAALAWNTFMQMWLPTVGTVGFLKGRDSVTKWFVYALAVTAIAVTSVTVLARVRKRLERRKLVVE
jgi:Family of unknown function (DUF5654)